jgi:signal transduction histidine kinase
MPADELLLILDTYAASRTRLAAMLAGLGFRTRHADSVSGAIAVWKAVAHPILIVVTHGHGPGSVTHVGNLRAQLPEATMIAIGERSVPTILAAWRAGADDYVLRPTNKRELQDALDRAAGLRAERSANMERLQRIELRLMALEAEQQAHTQSRATAILRQLALDLAHEINNPLTPILGMTEMLLEDLPIGHAGHEYAESIIDSALRIRDVVRRLIVFAEGESDM